MQKSRDKKSVFARLTAFKCGLLHLCLLLLSGCGYQFGQGDPLLDQRTLCVPYVLGDLDGDMTAALIHQLSTSGQMKYSTTCGDLILKVKLINLYDENIGFRYDRNKEGKRVDVIIPSELRRIITAEICVINAANGCVLIEPVKISASVDCDHDFNDIDGRNTFSIGQLTNEHAAKDAMMRCLNRILAQKIVDYLNNTW
jgi:hypothetical protein